MKYSGSLYWISAIETSASKAETFADDGAVELGVLKAATELGNGQDKMLLKVNCLQ